MLATSLLSDAALRFVLLGAATGSLTALVALAIVVVHRVSGVLNFAAGALGSIGAFVCYALRDDHGWPAGLALVAGLATGTVIGVLTYEAMALLRHSSVLSRVIATLALMSVAVSAATLVWDDQLSQPQPMLPSRVVTLGGDIRIGQDRLILIAVALALAAALGLVYRRTLFGVATAAVAEDRRIAAIAGWSPSRVELANYAIAGLLSALAAILLSPILTLNASILALTVLPALAAALVGRFSSFTVTVGAALLIGVLQSEIALFRPDIARALHVSEPSLTELPQAVPLVIILVVAVLRGRSLPARGETGARLPVPGAGRVPRTWFAAAGVAGLAVIWSASSYADALVSTFAMGIVVASVVVVTGYAGQLSLCQLPLAGFGAWVAARAASSFGVAFPVAVLIGTIAAVVVGIVVALPAIRTRGMTLGVTTLALALVFTALIFENASLTGGFDGLVVGTPRIAGFDVDPLMHPQRYATVVLVAFLVLSLVVANLRVGGAGRSMIAVRSNERAAAAVGISVIGVKLYAFALSAGIAAVGGILLAFRQPNVNFLAFDVFGSIQLVVYAVLGGIGWISGAVVGGAQAPGGVATRVLSDALPDTGDIGTWIAIVGGVLVLLAIRKSPDGAAAMVAAAYRRLRPSPGTPGSVRAAPAPPRSRAAGRGQAIAVRDVSVRFGGVNAVDGVSFSASPGEVVGLIGPNGAGKTTLLDVISGFTRPAAGQVLLGDEDISSWSPTHRGRAGIARSWQAVELFDDLTVRENLLVAEEARRARHYFRELLWRRRTALSAEAMAVVDDLGLRDVLDERPPTLPTGVAKLVGIARATVATPGVVLLDEPAAGLDDIETRELGEVIRRIAGSGTTVVVIEHDMSLIRTACDRIVVLDFGRKIADGHPDDVCASDVVVRAYLGEPAREVDAAASAGSPS